MGKNVAMCGAAAGTELCLGLLVEEEEGLSGRQNLQLAVVRNNLAGPHLNECSPPLPHFPASHFFHNAGLVGR
jgi:hypothetical protein